jgi:Tfp pilus assembly protein PilF
MLAYAYELAANPGARRAALQESLQLMPNNDELRLQLASTLAEERKYADAQTVLAAHHRLHEDPIAAALYLELMRLNNDTAAERRFLAVPLTGALALDENVREHCAAAYEAGRDFPAAERLRRELLAERPEDPVRVADLARVLLLRGRVREATALLEPLLRRPTPDTLRLAAEVALAAGRVRDAEKYQLAYLQAVRTAASSEWSALGDIRLSSGNRSGARSAYAEALRRLQTQVAQKEPAR